MEHMDGLPKFCETLEYDFRIPKKESYHNSRSNSTSPEPSNLLSRTFRVVQWNIERGYKLDEVVDLLKRVNADILCLQELYIGCKRSKCVNSALIIARELQMKGVFVTEFEELES
jgi:hypothetical protein